MAGWIDAIMSPLNAAGDVAKSLVDIRDTVKFRDAVIKLQVHILSAQQGALTAQAREMQMAEEISRLKAHVAEIEAWAAQKERYELKEFSPGVFVYALKPGMEGGEAPHQICQTCYQHGKRSILHADEQHSEVYHLTCHECGTQLQIGHIYPPSILDLIERD